MCYYSHRQEVITTNERIALLRKNKGMTQEEFGAAIGGLSRNYIWMIEKGDRSPSDRTIADICREFDVNETWLRTGDGPMFVEKSRDEELADFFGRVLSEESDLRRRLLAVMSRLDVEEWEMLARMACKLAAELEAEKDPGQ